MCLPSTFWRTERRTVVKPMTSQFGCLELLITRTFLSGPVKFEITRVNCSADPDQTAPSGAVCLGSTLFAISLIKKQLHKKQNLGIKSME